MDDAVVDQTLNERARKLARMAQQKTVESPDCLDLVHFNLGDEAYAIESSYIREVYPLQDLTPLPCVPPFVAGIISIRRKIVSVIDLKKLFDLPDSAHTAKEKIMVLGWGGMEFAIIADTIVGAASASTEKLHQDLPTLTGLKQRVLKGVTSDRLIIIDGEKLLTEPSLVVDEK